MKYTIPLTLVFASILNLTAEHALADKFKSSSFFDTFLEEKFVPPPQGEFKGTTLKTEIGPLFRYSCVTEGPSFGDCRQVAALVESGLSIFEKSTPVLTRPEDATSAVIVYSRETNLDELPQGYIAKTINLNGRACIMAETKNLRTKFYIASTSTDRTEQKSCLKASFLCIWTGHCEYNGPDFRAKELISLGMRYAGLSYDESVTRVRAIHETWSRSDQ